MEGIVVLVVVEVVIVREDVRGGAGGACATP